MSIKAVAWATGRQVGDHAAKLVLIMLADYAHPEDDICREVNSNSLATLCEMSVRSVQYKLGDLVRAGFLDTCRVGRHRCFRFLIEREYAPLDRRLVLLTTDAQFASGTAPDAQFASGSRTRTNSSSSSNKPSSSKTTKETTLDAFERAWRAYPKRAGGNSKADASKAWLSRLAQGYTIDQLESGVLRYALYVDAAQRWGTEYVLQGKTFFGPGLRFLEDWEPPATPQRSNGRPKPVDDEDESTYAGKFI